MKTARLLPLILLCGCSHSFHLPPTPAVPAPPDVAPESKPANLCDSLKGKPEELSCLMGLIAPERK